MILNRLGDKKSIAKDIIKYFPPHTTYIEPFFGAGGMFFSKPKAKYNILNDLDNDVYNLFKVVTEKPEEFKEALEIIPYHESVFKEFKNTTYDDPIKKAVRFIYLSNFGLLGDSSNLRSYVGNNSKINTLCNLDLVKTFLKDSSTNLYNKDAYTFFKDLFFRGEGDIKKAFTYLDPPYLNTGNNYSDKTWSADKLNELITWLNNKGLKFACSEYATPEALEVFNHHKLHVVEIKTKQALNAKQRPTEILAMNYKPLNTLF